jgi:hypothetical protein
MSRAAAWIEELTEATRTAEAAEKEYRAEYAKRVEKLAQERAFAFRRANLLRAVADVVAKAEDEPTAVAYGLTTLRGRLGWDDESAAREEIIARFAPVCAALHDGVPPEGAPPQEAEKPKPDPAAALAAFEAWHLEARGVPFWVLFERWMPETPVVDF